MTSEASKTIIPDWVKPDIFIDILNESVEGFVRITNFKADSGSAPGENYATIMLRVNIQVELKDGSEKSISFMLKLPHQSEMYLEILKKNNFFEAERTMYNTIIPEMEELYREAGVEVKFGAKSYDLRGVDSYYVLLEDLAPHGFKNMNRIEGLDQVHTESALRKLSQWHAASAARVANIGPYPEKYSIGFFREENRAIMTHINSNTSQDVLNGLLTFEDNEEYIEHVKIFGPKYTDISFKLSEPDSDGLNVLNHGDFWSNNIMFSHDSIGNFYHENLVENLKLLKYTKSLPTLRDIHISLLKYGFWGYLTATRIMNAVLADPSEKANFDDLLSDTNNGNEFKKSLYSNPRYQKHVKLVLPWLLNRGVFEEY
ncbi:uncharacterized protein LOC117576558 isoform X2 [Drosophila albomicans]|uniref:Uncharacterized protein LOC117576558 isoform X2 n=1 Tax=Drosophila albomicans TaxID=7291 RepID=A0A9C6TBU8_DROAB|nr:uncharacterized protein LOC117576558 isoform X2 [Drosophila albomicans]